MLIKIMDNMNSPWSISIYGELMVNSKNLNDFERAYDDAITKYYELSNQERELLTGAHPSLVAAYRHATHDQPVSEIPRIIEIFTIIKRDWGSDVGPIDLPEYEDLIEEEAI